MKEGNLQQLLDCSSLSQGRILLASHIPMSQAPIGETHHSSNLFAWHETEGKPYCKDDEVIPTSSIRWGRVSLKGGFEGWQFSPDGYGAVLKVKKGMEWVIVARPVASSNTTQLGQHPDFRDFASPNLFVRKFKIDGPSLDNSCWILEAVLLRENTQL